MRPLPEEEQHRRSLYIFMQRSLLPPLMTAFDMPDTTLPCGRRDATTVAPQALSLLNNDFVHRRSLALAQQALGRTDRPEDRMTHIWRAVYGRSPAPVELAAAIGHVTRQKQRFEQAPNVPSTEPAWRSADRFAETDSHDPELLAWASLCVVLFNSNEFLYVD